MISTIETTEAQDAAMARLGIDVIHCTQPAGARTALYCTEIDESRVAVTTVYGHGAVEIASTSIDADGWKAVDE